MKSISEIVSTNPDLANLQNTKDTEKLSKQIETLFVTELIKRMMEQTSLGKDKVTNNFLPFITSEFAKTVAENGGIGVGDFLTRTSQIQRLTQQQNINNSSNNHIDHSNPQSPATKKIPQADEIFSQDFNKTVGWQQRLSLPLKGRISSSFGLRKDPFNGRLLSHNGIDIALKENTEIKSAGEGKVVYSGEAKGYGNTVIIDHGNGITTLYGHNAKNLVKTNDVVTKDTVIALSGATGKSTGPHLHFEVRKDGKPINPINIFG